MEGAGGILMFSAEAMVPQEIGDRPLVIHYSHGRCREVALNPKSPECGKGTHEEVTELIVRGNKIKDADIGVICRYKHAS